jgi:hypothetical protein
VTGASIVLVSYTAGFPLLCFILLARAFNDQGTQGVLGWLRRKFPILHGHKQHHLQRGTPTSPKANTRISSDIDNTDSNQVSMPAELPEYTPEELQTTRENTYGYLFLSWRPAAAMVGPMCVYLISLYFAALGVWLDQDSLLKIFLFGLAWVVQTGVVSMYLPYDSWWHNGKTVLIGLGSIAHATMLISVQRNGWLSGYFSAIVTLFCIVCVLALFRERLATVVPWCRIVHRRDLSRLTREAVKKENDVLVSEMKMKSKSLNAQVSLHELTPDVSDRRRHSMSMSTGDAMPHLFPPPSATASSRSAELPHRRLDIQVSPPPPPSSVDAPRRSLDPISLRRQQRATALLALKIISLSSLTNCYKLLQIITIRGLGRECVCHTVHCSSL